MTDRTKLTEDDVQIIQAYEGIHIRFMSLEGSEIVWELKDAETIKQQILDDYKFREEYNKPYSIRLTYQKLEAENKQLKDSNENFINQLDMRNTSVDNLTNKLKEYEVLASSPEEIDRVLDENVNLKQKLEKIEEYLNSKMYSNDERFNKFISNLKEILKE